MANYTLIANPVVEKTITCYLYTCSAGGFWSDRGTGTCWTWRWETSGGSTRGRGLRGHEDYIYTLSGFIELSGYQESRGVGRSCREELGALYELVCELIFLCVWLVLCCTETYACVALSIKLGRWAFYLY
jgi:hypothetical protein